MTNFELCKLIVTWGRYEAASSHAERKRLWDEWDDNCERMKVSNRVRTKIIQLHTLTVDGCRST